MKTSILQEMLHYRECLWYQQLIRTFHYANERMMQELQALEELEKRHREEYAPITVWDDIY